MERWHTLVIPVPGSRYRLIPGDHWPTSLAYLSSSRLMRDPVPKDKVDSVWRDNT